MNLRPLFITALVAFLAGIVVFVVLFLTSSRPVTEGGRPLPVVGSRSSPAPAFPGAFPPPAPGPILRANPISPESGSPLGRPLAVQEFVEPILDAVGDAARQGRLPALPNAFQIPPAAGGAYSPTAVLPRYEDLVKPGAPFLFPPRYVRYLRAIRRIMVLNRVVAADFHPEIRENRDAIAIMERFADYFVSLQPLSPAMRAQRKQEFLNGIRFDVRLLASEFPAGFSIPAGAANVSIESPPGSVDAALRSEIDALAAEVKKLKPPPSSPLGFCPLPSGHEYFFERLLASFIQVARAQDDVDVEGIGEVVAAAACIIGSGTIVDCYAEAGPNPIPGSNLWAPCCDCGIPVKGFCIPIGCLNLLCRYGNAIWDPATGICGCDMF